jgi:hypothetical protein
MGPVRAVAWSGWGSLDGRVGGDQVSVAVPSGIRQDDRDTVSIPAGKLRGFRHFEVSDSDDAMHGKKCIEGGEKVPRLLFEDEIDFTLARWLGDDVDDASALGRRLVGANDLPKPLHDEPGFQCGGLGNVATESGDIHHVGERLGEGGVLWHHGRYFLC